MSNLIEKPKKLLIDPTVLSVLSTDRSARRWQQAAFYLLGSVFAKSIQVITLLVSTPLTINYLDATSYGLWITIASVLSLLGFADFGLGNSLLNAISQAHGKDDRNLAQRYVTSAFFSLFVLGCILIFLAIIIGPWIPWVAVYNLTDSRIIDTASASTLALVVMFAMNLPLGVSQRIQVGYQEGFTSSLWQALGNLLGFIGVLTAIFLKGNLFWLTVGMYSGPLVANLAAFVTEIGFRKPWLRPSWNTFFVSDSKRIIGEGLMFFGLQLAVTLAFASDNLIISHVLGIEAVVLYAVVRQMFTLVSTIQGLALNSLWPAYAEAKARGDFVWLRQTFMRSLVFSIVIAALCSLPLWLLGNIILEGWLRKTLAAPFLLLSGFFVWNVLSAYGSSLSIFMNGVGLIKFQFVIALLFAIISIPTKVYLAVKLDQAGIIWGTNITYIIFSLIPATIYLLRVFSNLEQRLGENLEPVYDV
jgi:O-antigen/teichoic acid export membrane protein